MGLLNGCSLFRRPIKQSRNQDEVQSSVKQNLADPNMPIVTRGALNLQYKLSDVQIDPPNPIKYHI